jgi:hypothetical protein
MMATILLLGLVVIVHVMVVMHVVDGLLGSFHVVA